MIGKNVDKNKFNKIPFQFWLGKDNDYFTSIEEPLPLLCPAQGYKYGIFPKNIR